MAILGVEALRVWVEQPLTVSVDAATALTPTRASVAQRIVGRG